MVGVCCYLVLFFVVVLAAVRWGVNSLAAAADEDAATIAEVHEPFLIMQGCLILTPRGRRGLSSAHGKIGAAPPARPDRPRQDLF
jgi:Holliday junction DNA helicase RuvB